MKSTLETKIDELLALQDLNGHSTQLSMLIADYCHIHGKRLEALLKYQEIAQDENSFIPAAHLNLAYIYMRHALYSDAYKEILTVLKQQPKLKFTYLLLNYFQTVKPMPEELQAEFSNFETPIFEIEELHRFISYPDSILKLLNVELTEYNEYLAENKDDCIVEYKKRLVQVNIDLVTELRNYIAELLNELYQKAKAEEEARIAEEEARKAEEERLRLEEEERARREAEEAERRRLEEEERARREAEEAERRRLEEEEQRRQELEMHYSSIAATVSSDFDDFIKQKGVKAALLLARDGYVIYSLFNDDEPDHDWAPLLSQIDSFVKKHHLPSQSGFALNYWVLEFADGQIAFKFTTPDFVFITMTDSSANFGVLKYSIDKLSEQIAVALKE